jgi:hypothetical protein
MNDQEWKSQEAMRREVGGFLRWIPSVRDGTKIDFGVVLGPWCDSEFTEWVRAEDAIRRESELLARIKQLEERIKRSAG